MNSVAPAFSHVCTNTSFQSCWLPELLIFSPKSGSSSLPTSTKHYLSSLPAAPQYFPPSFLPRSTSASSGTTGITGVTQFGIHQTESSISFSWKNVLEFKCFSDIQQSQQCSKQYNIVELLELKSHIVIFFHVTICFMKIPRK